MGRKHYSTVSSAVVSVAANQFFRFVRSRKVHSYKKFSSPRGSVCLSSPVPPIPSRPRTPSRTRLTSPCPRSLRLVRDLALAHRAAPVIFQPRPQALRVVLRVIVHTSVDIGVQLKGVRSGVERRRGVSGLKARDPGRRETPGEKVLKDRRPPRRRGRMGTSVRERARCRHLGSVVTASSSSNAIRHTAQSSDWLSSSIRFSS